MPTVTRTFGSDSDKAYQLLCPCDEFLDYFDNMVVESCNFTESQQVDITQDEDGEYIPGSKAEFGKREELQITFKAKTTGTIQSLELQNPGALDSAAVTNVTISTAKGQKATVSVTAHRHLTSAGVASLSHDTRERSTTIPAFACFGASTFGLTLGVDSASLQSGTYTIEFLHTDEDAADGSHLCGITHGVKHTATFEAVEDTDWTIPEGWVLETKGENESNTAYRRRTLTISKYEASPIDHSDD